MAVVKRPMKVSSSKVSGAEFMRLQAKYDAELRASGFRDIEDGSDLNLSDSSTFRRVSETGGHGAEVVIGWLHLEGKGRLRVESDHACGDATRVWADDDGGETGSNMRGMLGRPQSGSVFDSPRARAWMRFSQAAHEIPTDPKMRAVLVDVADTGSIAESAARNGLSERRVYDRVTRLCEAIGLDRRSLLGAVTDVAEARPEPVVAPVRKLSKREVRSLRYEAPGERKAS